VFLPSFYVYCVACDSQSPERQRWISHDGCCWSLEELTFRLWGRVLDGQGRGRGWTGTRLNSCLEVNRIDQVDLEGTIKHLLALYLMEISVNDQSLTWNKATAETSDSRKGYESYLEEWCKLTWKHWQKSKGMENSPKVRVNINR